MTSVFDSISVSSFVRGDGIDHRASARVATTVNGALATAFNVGDLVDGVILVNGDRILLKNQTSGLENGIYIVNGAVAPLRAPDFRAGDKVIGKELYIREGTVNGASGFRVVSGATVNTDALVFSQISDASSVANGSITYRNGTDIITLPPGTNGQSLQIVAGEPAWSLLDLASSDEVGSSVLGVVNGGTGAATLSANGVLLGNGTSAVTATAELTNGQLLIGSTGNAPSAATLTQASANRVVITNSAGGISLSLPQDIHTSATPTFASETLTATSSQLTLGTTNTTTISSVAPAGSRTYTINDASAAADFVLSTSTIVNGIYYATTTGGISQTTPQGAEGTVLHGNGGVPSFSAVSLTTDVTGVLPPDNGGTGFGTGDFSAGDILYASDANTLSQLAIGTNGQSLQIVAGLPVWSLIDLASSAEVGTSVLGVVNGGTNSSTALNNNRAMVSSSGSIIESNAAAGVGQALVGTAGTPAFGALDVSVAANTVNNLLTSRGGTGLDGSAASNGSLLIGNGSGYTLANITGDADQVIVTNSSGGIALSTPQDINTTSSPTFANVTVAAAPTADSDLANKLYVDTVATGLDPKESVRFGSTADIGGTYATTPSNGQFTGINALSSSLFEGNTVASFTATIDDGAAGLGTILTVSAVASGSIVVGQTISGTGITLGTKIIADTGGLGGVGTYTVDTAHNLTSLSVTAFTLVNGDRILIKDQTDMKQNGIYTLMSGQGTAAGIITRATDQDGSPAAEVSGGNFTFIEIGMSLAQTGWVLVGDGIQTLNVDNLTWTQFNGASGVLGGSGINVAGNTVSADLKANSGLVFDGIEISMDLSASAITGILAATDGGTGIASYVWGDVLFSDANDSLSNLAAGTTGMTLHTNGAGADPSWSTLDLSLTAEVGTSLLGAANGGTGHGDAANLYTIGDILYASGTSALETLSDVAVGSVLSSGGVGVAPSWGLASALQTANAISLVTQKIEVSSTSYVAVAYYAYDPTHTPNDEAAGDAKLTYNVVNTGGATLDIDVSKVTATGTVGTSLGSEVTIATGVGSTDINPDGAEGWVVRAKLTAATGLSSIYGIGLSFNT